ncbi:hypothetical protein DM806_24000 [Sphingobium lactosutens]|nr:hypothetical protein [Sphingobium lactosutens]
MRIARPPGGFKFTIAQNVQLLVNQECERNPSFGQHWADILERLRFVAHLEGVSDPRFAKGCRLWVGAKDQGRDLPRIKLVYKVLGDRVTINVASFGD